MIARKECQAAAATSNGGVIGSKYLGEWKYTTAFLQETFGISPTISTRECASVDHLPISNDKPTFIPKVLLNVMTEYPMSLYCRGHVPLRWRNSKWSCGTPSGRAELQFSFRLIDKANIKPHLGVIEDADNGIKSRSQPTPHDTTMNTMECRVDNFE
ncbi:hypothetical protein Ae201684P_017208 [Aphanomyces euteiches]|nr:hypothetical protein Ae201684P_012753 [Aphanomyces euteiches]KAH9088599.1 hypothetical protein Ae201684P_017208 [Aphanomyces euteiches]